MKIKKRNSLNFLLLRRLFAVLALALIFPESKSADFIPRTPHSKPVRTTLGPGDDPHIVIFKLKESASFKKETPALLKNRAAYLSLNSSRLDSLNRVFRSFSIEESAVEPLFDSPTEDARYKDYVQRRKRSGRELADLRLYHQIKAPAGTDSARLCDELNALPFIEIAVPALKPAPPPKDTWKPTPDFSSLQFYLNSKELGAGAVRHLPGADGFDVSIADVEYGWNLDHEDLEFSAESIDPENTRHYHRYKDHGTAVLGILGAKNNGYGVTGLSPGASLYTAPVFTLHGDYNPARIIDTAAGRLSPGDIILIEQQTFVCGKGYGPLEFFPPVFDAVSSAVSAGIVVVAPAGNGGVNLDDPSCEGLFDRNIRDSGAIIVGAGYPAASSYGKRVDVHGFGSNLVSTGYGSLFGFGDDNRAYTNGFGGTSGAGAIVSGATAVLQGILKAAGRPPLRSEKMRHILVETGSWPKGEEQKTSIGPLPNLFGAASALGFEVFNSHTVPLFFSNETSRFKSFVRVSNLSEDDGWVFIEAFDKNGNHFGPISFFLAGKETARFNSRDLQREVGSKGAGIYRLIFTSALSFESRAYVRFPDGFYTGMNETVPYSARSRREFHIKIFEPPGKYKPRRSFLYLTNPSDRSALVEIRVRDDFGNPVFEKSASFSIPPQSSLTLSAKKIQQFHTDFPDDENTSILETDLERLSLEDDFFKNTEDGGLFVGKSKWQLFVSSDRPVHVMNLMFDSSSGHLSNLSR